MTAVALAGAFLDHHEQNLDETELSRQTDRHLDEAMERLPPVATRKPLLLKSRDKRINPGTRELSFSQCPAVS
jgi:hypothetical protein